MNHKRTKLNSFIEWIRGSHISMTTDTSSKSYNRFFPLHIFTFWAVSVILLILFSITLVNNYYSFLDSKIDGITKETESMSIVNSSFQEQFETIDSIRNRLSEFELNEKASH